MHSPHLKPQPHNPPNDTHQLFGENVHVRLSKIIKPKPAYKSGMQETQQHEFVTQSLMTLLLSPCSSARASKVSPPIQPPPKPSDHQKQITDRKHCSNPMLFPKELFCHLISAPLSSTTTKHDCQNTTWLLAKYKFSKTLGAWKALQPRYGSCTPA